MALKAGGKYVHYSKLRYRINQQIIQHCRNGNIITHGVRVYRHDLLQRGIPPNTYTLFALLIGCRESNAFQLSHTLWTELVAQQQVRADLNCHKLMIELLSKQRCQQQPHDDDVQRVHFQSVIDGLHAQSSASLSAMEWYHVLHVLSTAGDTSVMLQQYMQMKAQATPRVPITPHILTALLEGVIQSGDAQCLEWIWNDVLDEYEHDTLALSQIIDCRVLQCMLAGICRLHRYYEFTPQFVSNRVWSLAITQLNITMDTQCFCLAVLTFSKFGHTTSEFRTLNELLSDTEMLDKVAVNSIGFRQILTALSNIGSSDKAWLLYHKSVKGRGEVEQHDINALLTIAQGEQQTHRLQHILHIVRTQFELHRLELYSLYGLYRVAVKCDDVEFKKRVLRQLNVDDIGQIPAADSKLNVVAYFCIDGKHHIIPNGCHECPFDSPQKVDALMQKANYEFDTLVCNEIHSESARQQHLKYHAEKKALAILLKCQGQHQGSNKLSVTVSIAMCSDCHKFFATMSAFFDCDIECVDSVGCHLFRRGLCVSCNNNNKDQN